MFCWKRKAASNLPLSFGGKSVSRDEVFACECAASPSEGQSQQLTVIAPAGILHQMNFGSFSSHVLSTLLSFFSAIWRIGSQQTTNDLFGAHAHRGIQTKIALRFYAALKWNIRLCLPRAVLMWPLEKTSFLFGVCVCPSASPPDPLSSEQRNVYMKRDCQGFKLHPLRNELSS